MGKLDGKVAIVTGSARGIGKEIALLFAAEGAAVVCTSRTLIEGESKLEGSLTTTVSEIKAKGGTAVAIQSDLAIEESRAQLVSKAREVLGPIDVLVNNAVLSYNNLFKDYSVKRWNLALEVSVLAPMSLAQKVLPDMIERHSGAIVNLSSGGAIGPGRGPYKEIPTRGNAVYGACKAFIERFTQGLAQEVYQYGVSVTAFGPSQLVMTPSAYFLKLSADQTEPMEMMAKTALLLATEPLDKVTGRVTYSQAILKEFGWIREGRGTGIDRPGSGYTQI